MKLKLFIFLLSLLFTSFCFAAEVTLDWNNTPGATLYEIDMSLDYGVTWKPAVEATSKPFVYVDVPEDCLVLFRITAFNNFGQTVNRYAGAWYDHRRLLTIPKGLSAN